MFKVFHLGCLALLVMSVSACSSISSLPKPNAAQGSPGPEPKPARDSSESTPEATTDLKPSPTDSSTPSPANRPTEPSPEQSSLLASLKSQGAAPELFNQVWLNSQPLKLANLRGQVIVVDFWTFDCINCIHVTPTLREWYHKYHDKGLVVIGVHSPEFEYEKDLNNVRDAIARLGVPYPVAIDNDFRTWQAFRNQYWPTLYFIDKAGQIRHVHIGEGDYDQSEQIIRALLAESIS